MNVTFFHKTNLGYDVKTFKDAKVRIHSEESFLDGSSENNTSVTIRIFTKEPLKIFTNDRCVLYSSDEKVPPKDSFKVKSIDDNTNGILSHMKVICVC